MCLTASEYELSAHNANVFLVSTVFTQNRFCTRLLAVKRILLSQRHLLNITICSKSRRPSPFIKTLTDSQRWKTNTLRYTFLRSHSNDIRKLLVPPTHNKLGERSFSAAGPRLWNDLPRGLRQQGLSFDSFRRSLKTHLFGD